VANISSLAVKVKAAPRDL